MRKSRTQIPQHCLHKPSGRGYVRLCGQMIYTGVYGSREADREYERWLTEWLANGRLLPGEATGNGIRVDKLVALYWAHGETYYCRDGVPTKEMDNIRLAVRPLVELYGNMPVAEFSPKKLKALRERLIEQGLARSTVNARSSIIQRLFDWGAEEEFVSGTVAASLRAVKSLRKNRSRARETQPVRPVPEADFRAVLPHLPREVAAMAELQWLTGMRPGEVTQMRWRDIEKPKGALVWIYRPEHHKTEHHGKVREIPIGPKGKVLLEKFRKLDPMAAIFSPKNAEVGTRVRKRAARKSKITPSQMAREHRASVNPKRSFNPFYETRAYGRAIARACKQACVDHWSPNRLRHSAATRIRKEYSIDMVRALLGHSSPAITEIYAELDLSMAIELMAEQG
jgi:integrase